jgi:peptide/nickel transport system permease protein
MRDIPVVQGAILMIVLWFLIINTIVDILYAVIDPRISHE